MHIPNIGEVFEGRYEVRRLLGRGGFATVYLAWDAKNRREVVLKILSPDVDGTYPATITARFHREAQIFAALAEPHIVKMFDFGQTADGLLYMVFEYVAGEDLAVLMRKGPLAPNVIHHIIGQLLEALREAHRHGVLHRDLKPANVLIYTYGDDPYRVKLIDFGIAKDTAPDATRLTQTGNVVGTLRYMAPEQIFGEPMTPASDIFALGMVAWEMVMGRPLIGGVDKKEMLQQHATLESVTLPPIPQAPELHAAILRALMPDPEQRFASADAMLAALRTPFKAPPQPAPPRKSRSKTTTRYITVGVVATAVVVGGSAGLLLFDEEKVASPVPARRDISSLTVEPEPTAPKVESDYVETVDLTDPCSRLPPFTGRGKLGGGLVQLDTFIPRGYDPKKPPGLVLGLHRRLRSGLDFLKYTEISEYAEKHNWVVIAPDSKQFADWTHDLDEAALAIDVALGELCIDRTKLHILADEAGVSYARRISCELPVSSVVTAYDPGAFTQCEPFDPAPYMRIYTLQDGFHNRKGRGCAPILGNFGSWDSIVGSTRSALQCTDDRTEPWEPFPDACENTTSCPNSYVVCGFDGGHLWPASKGWPTLLQGCRGKDPKTEAPLIDAAAAFMANEGRTLTPEQIAKIDRVLGRPQSKSSR